MVRRLAALLAMGLGLPLMAQEGPPSVGSGLLRGAAAICPGFLLDGGTENLYINGRLEYFADDRVSFRGEGYRYIDSQQQPAPLVQNSQFAFGPFLHHVHGRLDLAAGFEAGLSLAQPALVSAQGLADPAPLRAVPNASLCGSLAFNVWTYMHFFADVRYVHARYNGAPGGPIALDEVMVMAGLGFQLPTKE
jgi:hypothetical protein